MFRELIAFRNRAVVFFFHKPVDVFVKKNQILALAEARASAADAARHSVAAELSRLRAHRVHKGKAVPYPPPLFLHPPPTIPNTG